MKQLIKEIVTYIGVLIVAQIIIPIGCTIEICVAFRAYRDYLSAFMDIAQEQEA